MKIFTDQMNRSLKLDTPVRRIISLVPSQTELLFDLGLEEEVLGITRFCIHPEKWFKSKTRIGGTKNLSLEKIAALQPDLIIGNKEENDQEQIEWLMQRFPVWMSDIETLPHALEMIEQVGKITDTSIKAATLTLHIREAFASLEQFIPATSNRCLYFIWNNPMMLAGTHTFIHDMLQRNGFLNVGASAPFSGRYPEISEALIHDLIPDYLFLSSEPFPFAEKHLQEFQEKFPGATTILVDGEMFSWYGSRLKKAVPYFLQLHQQIKERIH
jgi:ABC-type Fe3+-hydroxamate transport system substrate-binding protein